METNSSRPRIFLYTDGASSGNPGPGGYGVVLKCAGHEKEMSGPNSKRFNIQSFQSIRFFLIQDR